MSKSKYNIDKLILIENNIKLLLNDLHEKDDYLKANNDRHYLNEIIIKNQNDLLRIHDNKLKIIEYNFKSLISLIIILFITTINIYLFYYINGYK